MRNVQPVFQRGNPHGYGEPNPPCERFEPRQHIACARSYFSRNWMHRETWKRRYDPATRARFFETSAEWQAAWIRNRSIECEDCMAEEFGIHPGEARQAINRMYANGGKTTFRGVPIELVDLRTIPSRPEGALPVADLLTIPTDDPMFADLDGAGGRW